MTSKSKSIDALVANQSIQDQNVDLSKYTSISESAAQIIAKSGVFHLLRLQLLGEIGLLDSPGQILSHEEVTKIYKTRVLRFDGMRDICPSAAQHLFKSNKRRWTCIYLNGIKKLNWDLADHFGGHEGNLFLNGLEKVTEDAARLLSLHSGHLSLDGLKSLTDSTAKWLGRYKGYWLSLNGIHHISESCAESLMTYDRDIFSSSKDIYDSPAELHEVFMGNIRLNGLNNISDRIARSLSRNFAGIELNGVKSISEEQALLLSSHKGGLLSLNGLENISTDVAAALVSNHKGALHLNGITEITDSVAEHLGRYQGTELFLNGLKNIKESCAKKNFSI